MEIYESDLEEDEPYDEALRQQLLQQYYIPPAYRNVRNVPSLNIDKLFSSSSLAVNNKPKCIVPRRKDSGDFFHLGSPDVNYHKIIIEKCNRNNKGCMCKPLRKKVANTINTNTTNVIDNDNFKEQSYTVNNNATTKEQNNYKEKPANTVNANSTTPKEQNTNFKEQLPYTIHTTTANSKDQIKEQPYTLNSNTINSKEQSNFKEQPQRNISTLNSRDQNDYTKEQLHPVTTNSKDPNNFRERYQKENEYVYKEFKSKDVQAVPNINYKDVNNQTIEPYPVVNKTVVPTSDVDTVIESDIYKGKSKSTSYRDCKKQKDFNSRTDAKLCVPSNFEEILQSTFEAEKEFPKCKSKQSCSCQTYDAEHVLIKGKFPGENVCVQKEPQAIVTKKIKHKKSTSETKSTESSSCSCEKKKKCFCFRKKHHKDSSKVNREKSIQTRNMCCSNKCYQVSPKQNKIKVPSSNSNDEDTLTTDVSPIYGKVSNKSCKKCCKSCAKNTIMLPPKPLLGSDQADTLKTLIKMEAKQNYRQVNIILQELNEQKSEIKKLIQLYQCLSNNTGGNTLDMTSGQGIKKNLLMDGDNQRPQTVNICEGCGLHFYRYPTSENGRSDREQPSDNGDRMIAEDRPISSNADSNRGTKPISTNKQRVSDKPQNGIIKTTKQPEVLSEDAEEPRTKPKSTPKVSKDKLQNGVAKTTKNTKQPAVPVSDTEVAPKPNENMKQNVKQNANQNVKQNVNQHVKQNANQNVKQNVNENVNTESVLTLYSKDKQSDASVMQQAEKGPKQHKTNTTGTSNSEKTVSYCKSKSKAFYEWCKKSFVNLKEKDSKHLKKCSTFLRNKIKECQEHYRTRPKKSIFACFSQYFKKKEPTHP